MRSASFMHSVRAGLALLILGASAVTAAAAVKPGKPTKPHALSLFASAGYLFEVNRQQCGLLNTGVICAAFQGSPVGGAGYWPKGTPDQYIFWSGLQIAGLVARNSGFAWAGDTVGAFFVDFRGDQVAGSPLSPIFSRLDPTDVASWGSTPPTKTVLDPAIYNASLIGRDAISQGDVFVRYWEGDPARLTGREHPMGIAVDQRILAWNFPSGNEDIIYIIYTFYNVTARSSSGKYNNATIPAPLQAEIAAIGDQFQDINENQFKLQIPDGGYTIDSLYAAQGMDADVAVFSQNYATAIVPFNLGLEYTGTFLGDVGWQFPPDIFGPPFAPATGFIGIKFLKSPTDATGKEIGLTMFSQELNSATGFPDALGVRQLYRYLSGFLGPSDNPCNPNDTGVKIRSRHYCFLGQIQGDARFIQASGPLSLPAGEARSIVVAYINAAPVNVPGFAKGATVDVKPGTAGVGLTALPGDSIRFIDKIAGWVSHVDANADNKISQTEVTTVPRSLLDKALVAQAVFDNKFLLPFAPDAPDFFLVPGDNQVTVVWQQTRSEGTGDPFFAVASNPASPLYDPNFRQFDVEGYRIYRGRTSSSLELVAQFDYAGTSFVDYTAQIDYGDRNGNGKVECAPELGLRDTLPLGDCPVRFDSANVQIGVSPSNSVALAGTIVQVKVGDRVKLANGGTINLKADTAVVTQQCADVKCPPLGDTGVPFAFVDKNVRNSFSYFYAVTAFDLNSAKSGPTSLESPRVTKRVSPRKAAANIQYASIASSMVGDDNAALDPTRPWTIDANTGRFAGPPPPTGAGQFAATFAPLVPQLLPALDLAMTVDSVLPRTAGDFPCGALVNTQDICYEFFVSYTRGTTKASFRTLVGWPIWEGFAANTPIDAAATYEAQLGAFPVAADSASSARFGVPNGFSKFNAAVGASLTRYIRYSAMEGQMGRRLLGQISPGGSRWFTGADETVDHPTYSVRAGHIPGVDSIYAPLSHLDVDPTTPGVQNYSPAFADAGGNTIRTTMQCFPYVVAALSRQADIEVTWGPGGTIASVRDVTDHVDVPFHAIPQAGYGFIGDANGNGRIDWRDFDRLEGAAQAEADLGFCAGTDPGPGLRAVLVNQPVFGKVTVGGASPTGTLAGWTATGSGFGIYINGQAFIFQLSPDSTLGAAVPPPAAGTKWTLRQYAGVVDASTNPGTTTPSGYTYTPEAGSPAIPGLRVKFTVAQPTSAATEAADVLNNVHTVPDPYYVANALEITANQKLLKFVNLPPQAIIRIYSVSGVLVNVITHDDPGLGGEATWNLRNRNNQFVASGVYFYHVETPQGHTKVGRFTVVNFAP